MYAGTNAGLFRSTNSGKNWSQVNSALDSVQVYAVACNSSGYVFAGSINGALYKSTDNGVNWDLKISGLPNYEINNIVSDHFGNIYVSNFVGVYYSSNSGETWQPINSGIYSFLSPTCLVPDNYGSLYLSSAYGMFRASSLGANWESKNKNLIASQITTISSNSNGQIFASTLVGKLYRSSSKRDSWDELTLNSSNSIIVLTNVNNSKGDIIVSNNNSGIYRSTNNGNSFYLVSSGLDGVNVNSLVIDSLNNIYACTSNKGIYISYDNGDNWTPLNNGIENKNIVSLTTDSKGHIFANTIGEIYSSTNNGQTWTYVSSILNSGMINSILLKPNGYVFAACYHGLFRSTNNGQSFTQLTNGLGSNEIKSVISNSVGYLFASAAGSGVFKSTDNGDHWTQVNSGLSCLNVSVLAADVNGYLIAGTSGNGLYVSTNSTIPPIPAAPLALAPADSLSGSPLAVNLSWDSVAYAETYIVQVTTDTSFTNLAVNDSLVTATTRQVTGLSDGVKYYWRLAAKNASGTGSYSSVRSFSTIINTPGTLSAQAFPSGKIIINWADKSTNNIGYIVERKLSTDNNYTVIDTLNSDTVSFTDTTLTSINMYKYRVKAYNQIAVSPYSNEVIVKTLPPLPSLPLLSAPLSNLSNLSWTLDISWVKAENADSYRLQISKDSTFKTFFLNDSSITSTSRQVSGLEDGVRYYWRVSSINAAGVSPYSEIRSFSTLLNTPGTLTAQALPSEKIVLNWTDKSNNNIGYIIERKLVSDSSYAVIDTSKTDITVYTDTTLKSISTYTYRIKAYNKIDISLYSNEITIKTIPSYPASPILSDPLISASNPGTLNLNWSISALADSYRLQVSIDSVFKTFFLNDSTITVTTRQVTGLEDGVRYYWRVSSKNAAGVSPYSEVRSFSTLLNAPGNLTAKALWGYKVSLSWSDISKSVSGYIIERALAKDTIYTAIDTVKSNTASYTDSSLTSVNTYVYRVKAYNALGSSAYSNVATVSTITAVENKYSGIPTKYEVLQNYPNPFNPTTIIKYGLPVQSQVKIVVYNILGAVVKELANSVQSAGYHNVNFGGNIISSGVYFYKIEAKALDGSKQFREIKKMMLLK
jgi:photosystem II stability/assembly factor-like uncharacterized protein